MIKIKRALISVSDKSGILDFANELSKLGVEILSTGGTSRLLRENGIKVKDVSEYTGFPEIMDGRVKTLHPKVHGGLLAIRNNKSHLSLAAEHGIGLIDLLVTNLYPFEEVINNPKVSLSEAIENIDIGGPAMIRSAAKNHSFVAVICSPARYKKIIEMLKKNSGSIPEELARELAVEAFERTALYDAAINNYLKKCFFSKEGRINLPEEIILTYKKVQNLRYGENPHQKGAFYRGVDSCEGLTFMNQLQGKELSFNNILDLNSALELLKEFQAHPAAVIVKHNNPCGAAEADTLEKAYLNAFNCDKLSSFGGIVVLNKTMDLKTAKAIARSGFLECIAASGFDKGALSIFKDRKNLRIIKANLPRAINEIDFKRISGGLLLQDKDIIGLDLSKLKVVTECRPSKKEMESLFFAWKVAKHVKSNAIVLAKGTKTVGIGAGQMSRVDSVMVAKNKAGKLSQGSCLASDAFFPKADAIILAHKAGVKAIIQPGGSIADKEIIDTCNKYKISMVTTGIRHFRH